MSIHVCIHLSLHYAKPYEGYDQGTLSGVSLNLLTDLICP